MSKIDYNWKVIKLGSIYILTSRDKNYYENNTSVQTLLESLTAEMNVVDVALRKIKDKDIIQYDDRYNEINNTFGKMKTLIGKIGYAEMSDEIFVADQVEEKFGVVLFRWLQDNFIDKKVNPKDLDDIFSNAYNKMATKNTKLEKTFVIYDDGYSNVLIGYVYIYALDQKIEINRHQKICMEESSKHINQTLIMQKFKYVDPEQALGALRKRINYLEVRNDLVDYLIGEKKFDELNEKYNKLDKKDKKEDELEEHELEDEYEIKKNKLKKDERNKRL